MTSRVLTGKHLMSGNQAVAEGAIAAGVVGYFGYPITPSTSIMEHIVSRFPALDDYTTFTQMEDELGSIVAVVGCSWTRRKAMTATSGPGFSLMQEGLGLASFTETPMVLINVMRGGPSTGLPTFPGQQETMQTHFGSHGDYLIPTLVPSSIQECFDLTIEAFNISEALRTPVFVLTDEILSALKERLIIPPAEDIEVVNRASLRNPIITWKGEKISIELVPPFNAFGEDKKAFGTGLSHDSSGHVDLSADNYEDLLDRQHEKIMVYAHLLPQPITNKIDDAEILLVSYGSTARSCKRAMLLARKEGLKVGTFKITTLWPFPKEQLCEVAKGKHVLVVEMSRGQLIWPVERFLHQHVEHLPYYRGQVPQPSLIVDKIKQILGGN